uniref:Uncharacterized protein n=1 Tax=Aplanochytrium stocchinoi TaxID=215587 RepID=A0A7S3LKS6_9STRA
MPDAIILLFLGFGFGPVSNCRQDPFSNITDSDLLESSKPKSRPSSRQTIASPTRICSQKRSCKTSLAKLISNCSKPFLSNDSNPKISKTPTDGVPSTRIFDSDTLVKELMEALIFFISQLKTSTYKSLAIESLLTEALWLFSLLGITSSLPGNLCFCTQSRSFNAFLDSPRSLLAHDHAFDDAEIVATKHVY